MERDDHFKAAARLLAANLATELERYPKDRQRNDRSTDLYRHFFFIGTGLLDWVSRVVEEQSSATGATQDPLNPLKFNRVAERIRTAAKELYAGPEVDFVPLVNDRDNSLLITWVKDEVIRPILFASKPPTAPTPIDQGKLYRGGFKVIEGGKGTEPV